MSPASMSSRRPLGLPPITRGVFAGNRINKPSVTSSASPLSPSPVASTSSDLERARRQGHAVPEVLKERRGSAAASASATLIAQVPRTSHAEKVRTLVSKSTSATLCTVFHENGTPFGSVVNVAVDPETRRAFWFVSRLAEHSANLNQDERASLLVQEAQKSAQGDDVLAVARATLLGRAVKVPKTKELVRVFREKHPAAAYVSFDDFSVIQLVVDKIRYIEGFGSMSWISGEEYEKAQVDPVAADAKVVADAVQHMNEDHAKETLAMTKRFGHLPEATSATILSFDRLGMEILADTPDGKRRSRINFTSPLSSASQLQAAVVELSKRARM